MRRANKGMDPERRVVCGIAAVVAVVVASVAFFGWRACGRSVDAVGVDGAAIELKVNLRCDGWSSENTGLGVFVSGTQIDGATCDEQLVFEGSGVQTAYLGAGSYEIVPQLPSLMLRDGTVLAAGDAVARDYGEGSSAADDLEIAYAAIELRAVADCSFVFEDDANAAFERALERKSGEADHEA